ncbi:hypothetical protein T440DRAFT_512456 [Plenodomus tracheiphilus IPT5]|uniref:Uncharacterized protein n=1 Tax=Plenodomus tracheiphilus IPT5 TaxID=1408161 RepID=A0A6A7ALV6_9PLEO|nr:hypothetical protein T440DRAFT_512456 [Plenodomus tracheiphilus IPT5]
MMQRKNLRLADDSKGQLRPIVQISPGKEDEVLANMMPGLQSQLMVPWAIGELILIRQTHLLQCLNIAIEDILDTAFTTRVQTERSTKPADVATAALAKLSFDSPPKKVEISDLVDSAVDRKSFLEEYISSLFTEPTVLAHEVNLWFFTRPELVADEKGRSLPVHTDQYISGAVFDAVHGTINTAAVWNYISRPLALLNESSNKRIWAIVLQELSKSCHLEYTRAQAFLRRNVSAFSGGNKCFRRTSMVQKDDETKWSSPAQWLQKLQDLHRAHPLEIDKMSEREFNSIGELAVIVSFIQALSLVTHLPEVDQSKGRVQVKTGVDLGDFAIPIDNLLEPGMATGALTKLDQYLLEETGTRLGFYYQDLIDDSVANTYKRFGEQKAEAEEAKAEYLA